MGVGGGRGRSRRRGGRENCGFFKKIKINKQISFVEFKNSYNLFKDNLAVIENENAHLFIYIQFTIGFLVKHCKAIL